MSDRRRFLGWLGSASLFGAAPRMPELALPPAGANEHPQGQGNKWDTTWADRVKGQYRAVFDSPEASEGSGLVRATAWCDHYKEVYSVERSAMSPVLVLRHAAIDLIMNDAYWQRFKVGKAMKIKDSRGKWSEVNPISAASLAADARERKYKLETFMADGGIVLACAWAFGGRAVSRFQQEDKLERAAADARAREHIVPGVILQPNGIFAVLRAQEAGCKYVMAS